MSVIKKTALITGGAKRIGKAIAVHLASKGWNIVIHYNTSESDALKLANQLTEDYPNQKFLTVKTNLQNISETENLIPTLVSQSGTFELLINNASVFERNSISDTTSDFFDKHFHTNLRAPFILIRDFARFCKSGNIVNLTDTRIHSNQPGFSAYTLSKKALWELTKMAAVEFSPAVKVNSIAPGVTLAPFEEGESYLQKLAEKLPMKKPSGIVPVLQCLDFILSNNHMTGQLLYADGGENLVPK
jgi:NAD(P)-dependent dehydrogenase (short-subunit alcohol dehydrogenase family)